jgi:ribosomal protein S18 acetylase RimI-like enzyme
MEHPLDNPVWHALTGPQAEFAERYGRAARYQRDVALFGGVADQRDPDCWADLAALVGPGEAVVVPLYGTAPPAGWEVLNELPGVQLVAPATDDTDDTGDTDDADDGVAGGPAGAVRLGSGDVPEMIDLVTRTEPGPFFARTIEMGAYLGVRRGEALVAMAGERVRPPGWAELSGVCTDPAHRGQGLATGLVRLVLAGIRARGDTPYLHAVATNTAAIRLYLALGFVERTRPVFTGLRAPVG